MKAVEGGLLIWGRGEAKVYLPSGRLRAALKVEGEAKLSLEPGVYFAEFGGRRVKVLVR